MFDPEGVVMDPSVLSFSQSLQRSKGRSGRSKAMIFSDNRGRYIKPVLPKGKVVKLAVDATLRSAAPYQKSRRANAKEKGERVENRVFVETSDMRAKKMARKAGALVIFLVDASGSMALNRMASAKGACLRLLTDSYTNRDMVSVIPFYGNKAEVLLPPSKSIAMARRRLDSLPCGGGSPLSHGLSLAIRTALRATCGGDVGRTVIILLTDGRANVSLDKSNADPAAEARDTVKPTSKALKDEVLDMAKQCYAAGLELLVIDTESKFISTGFAKEIADAARGKYYYLPDASEKALSMTAASAI